MLSYFVLIATAGHDTTSATLAGGLGALIDHPDQLARLQEDPALIGPAIDEIVRWVSPVRHFLRYATGPADLGGITVAAGEALADPRHIRRRAPADADPLHPASLTRTGQT